MRRRGRMSLRDTMLQNQAADRYYASMSERPVDLAGIFADAKVPPPPKKRAKRELESGKEIPLESEIQKQIMDFLAAHPKVAWRVRQNVGEFVEGDRHIRTHYGLASDERMVDIIGQLIDGCFFAIEVKRPPWTAPKNKREYEQENFLVRVKDNGGIGFFAASLDFAKAAFESLTNSRVAHG